MKVERGNSKHPQQVLKLTQLQSKEGHVLSSSLIRKISVSTAPLVLFSISCIAQTQASFQQKASNANSSLPVNEYSVDLNNDGVPDIVQVLGGNLNTQRQFTVSLANGDGTFKAPVTYTIPEQYSGPMDLASGDFNNDGKVDLVFVTGSGTQLAVYLGNGNGTLQPLKLETVAAPTGVSFESGANSDWNTIVAADFNHDGKLDIAVQGSTSAASGVYLLPGNGDGTFGTARNVYTQTGDEEAAGSYLAIGDFDSDGNADLAFMASYSCSGAPVAVCSQRLHVLYGDGAFGFENTAPYTTTNIFYFATGDVDGDGHTDIFGIDVSNQLVVLYGESRTFKLYTMAAPGAFWDAHPSMGDFNGDGKMDIVVRGHDPSTPTQNENKLEFFLQNEPGSFTEQTYTVTSPNSNSDEGFDQYLIVGDFNKDTKPDVAAFYGSGVGSSPQAGESIVAVLNTTANGNWGGCNYPASGQGIALCATTGSTTSPVRVLASANSYGQLRKLELWVDGKKIGEQYHTWGGKAWIDLTSAYANGSHSATLFASDVDNREQKLTFSFAVGASSGCSAPSSPGVNICKPANGSAVASPVQIQAASTVTGTLARMELWVDGVKKYTETSSKTLSTSLTLAAGTHRFGVFAVNTAGTKWEGVVNATVK